MKTGLVLGKFMPVHKGHLALIDFARKRSDRLIVLLCAANTEEIDGRLRWKWLNLVLGKTQGVELRYLEFDPAQLSAESESSREASRLWAAKLKEVAPETEVFFSSEPYGEFVAEFMGIDHVMFDLSRVQVQVSATQIRERPARYWEFIPEPVRPDFVQTVCITGTESTGKTELTKALAAHFQTTYAAEAARDIVANSARVTRADLLQILHRQAQNIEKARQSANKVLFSDTGMLSAAAYARFLWDEKLPGTPEIRAANRFDLYLLLANDVPFVQDGTRLPADQRNALHAAHQRVLTEAGVPFVIVSGNWEERLETAIRAVEARFF